jgi:uncharacterized protein (DUF697 family)
MHDIDATALEGDFNHEQDGFLPAAPLSEADTAELAAELLEARSDAELDHFLGDLVKKAASSVRSFVSSPIGQAVVGGLKSVAKQALPKIGGAIGNAIMPGAGGAIGSKLAGAAGSALGLEVGSNASFEIAKDFVRMSSAAIQNAEGTPPGTPPAVGAKKAIFEAAKAHMPDLLSVPRRRRQAASKAMVRREPQDAYQLAAELLEARSDAELDQFLGDLVNKAVSGIKSFASSPVGKGLVSGLKAIAKTALPTVGSALGSMVAPGIGTAIGGALGSAASRAFEVQDGEEGFLGDILGAVLETQDGEEGFLGDLLETQDGEEGFLGDVLGAILEVQEPKPIEKAKQLVDVAAASAKIAARAPAGADIRATVRKAIADAIKRYAPDLAKAPPAAPQRVTPTGDGARGHWYRRGNKIIIVGV